MKNNTLIVLSIGILLVFSMFPDANSAEKDSLKNLFKRVKPSVVMIQTIERSYSQKESGKSISSNKLGSGVIISDDGLIMTAAHIVQVADIVSVKFIDGTVVGARIVGTVQMADIALLKLDRIPDKLKPAVLGNSDLIETGDPIFVIGTPYGIQHSLSAGYISGKRKPEALTNHVSPIEFLQTDASINHGNSGGPMFNMKGEVVGIVSHFLTKSGGFDGVGFAVSINTAKEYLLNRKAFWFGLETFPLTGDLAGYFNLPQDEGLLVQRVAADSISDHFGLKAGKTAAVIGKNKLFLGGDVILEIQGTEIQLDEVHTRKIGDLLKNIPEGTSPTIKVLRKGKILTLTLP